MWGRLSTLASRVQFPQVSLQGSRHSPPGHIPRIYSPGHFPSRTISSPVLHGVGHFPLPPPPPADLPLTCTKLIEVDQLRPVPRVVSRLG